MRPGGAVVNISGVIAERNLPGMAVYGASKAEVRAFDEPLAREARRAKVRVIDARPPHTETGLASIRSQVRHRACRRAWRLGTWPP